MRVLQTVSENFSCSIVQLDKPAGRTIQREPRTKPFTNIKKSVSSNLTLYLEDDDHNFFAFNGKTLKFTCQLVGKHIQFFQINETRYV